MDNVIFLKKCDVCGKYHNFEKYEQDRINNLEYENREAAKRRREMDEFIKKCREHDKTSQFFKTIPS